MTKRASGKFKRNARDLYDTPEEAVVPLMPYLKEPRYIEPCVGNGALVDALLSFNGPDLSFCSDIKTVIGPGVDATKTNYGALNGCIFITNPPWTRDILHPIIENLSRQAPTWLLFDADWMHTKQAIPYMEYCTDIVSVGRVSWMGNDVSGFDNCCWYHFDQSQDGPPLFHPRTV